MGSTCLRLVLFFQQEHSTRPLPFPKKEKKGALSEGQAKPLKSFQNELGQGTPACFHMDAINVWTSGAGRTWQRGAASKRRSTSQSDTS